MLFRNKVHQIDLVDADDNMSEKPQPGTIKPNVIDIPGKVSGDGRIVSLSFTPRHRWAAYKPTAQEEVGRDRGKR